MASPKILATLTFDAQSGRPPLQYLLAPEGKTFLTVGRAPKSDVVCTLSGISWNHLELHLPPGPIDETTPLQLLVKDLSMNGTGVRFTPQEALQKVPKETQLPLPDGGSIAVPVRKPKSKGNEDTDVIQQSFTVKLEHSTLQELPPQAPQMTGKRPAQTQAGNAPKRPATVDQVLPESCTQRLAKGEALLKAARQAESRGRLAEALPSYQRGLQHLIRVLPVLEKGNALISPAYKMIRDNLERAA
eukprot:CAMPEP_0114641298 /NCGR_PEP_ID=MMETSP0191-20121206/2178_1 /TAXON_ID=126664 /ORGANISM="Sorites sp." /LENGTH=244 /DNA_ID=CAMNT_0001853321 /DNA_START=14 /DNA_END=744 /DNA_ORIENTATION=+